MRGILRLATRASPLALWQARHAAARLRRAHAGLRVVLVRVVSQGDRDQDSPLAALGGAGVFTTEVQAAVLAGAADAGVHSCKDLPTALPAGLVLAAVLPRGDPRDVLVGAGSLADLPAGAVLATGSPRRRAQIRALRPDLCFAELRGNVHTRLARIARGDAAATCLALAGLRRLGLSAAHVRGALDPEQECTPAPGQAAVALDCRAGDRRTRVLLAAIACRDSAIAVGIERDLLAGLAGGCALPLGALAVREGGALWRLTARLGTPAGLRAAAVRGPAAGLAAAALGRLAP